jgi:hypothetical protein
MRSLAALSAVLVLQAACYNVDRIRPDELPKLNGSTTSQAYGALGGVIAYNAADN